MASSGIPALDKVLAGGYPDKSAILVEGLSGNEKEILGYEFINSGLDYGGFCLYVTGLSPSVVIGDARSLGIDLGGRILWMCPEGGDRNFAPADLANISFEIKAVLKEHGDRKMKVVIDLTSQLLMAHPSDSVYKFLSQLLVDLKKYDATMFATVQEDMQEPRVLAGLELLFDGVLSIRRSGEAEVAVKVKKMRGIRPRASSALVPLRTSAKMEPTPFWFRGKRVPIESLDKTRVAILPFANMSPDPNDSYFADGMTEEMISTVSGISGLGVISRTSVMGYKGTTKRLRDIGRELEVGSILEGSLRKAGNRIRITTQLIDVATDRHLWAESYDRELDDVFAVQSDVARQVAEALKVRILSKELDRLGIRPTENPAAFTLYLRGRHLWNSRGMEDVQKAAEYFAESIKEDPNFALGYVGLADCYGILHSTWGIDPEANREKARRMVEKALSLDPELAEGIASRALAFFGDYLTEEAEADFRRAIKLKPNYASAHQWYSHLLVADLRWDEAFEQIEKAAELDPLSPMITSNMSDFYYWRKDYPRALELIKRALDLSPSNSYFRLELAEVYGRMKMFDDARRESDAVARDLVKTFPFVGRSLEARLAYLSGDKDLVASLLPDLEAHPDESFAGADMVAAYHFYLGEADKGFEWLEKSFSSRERTLAYIKLYDYFDGVRSDPRYFSLLRRLGLRVA